VVRTLQDSENGRTRKMRHSDILFDGISEGAYLVLIRVLEVRNLKRVRKVEDSTDLMSVAHEFLLKNPGMTSRYAVHEDTLLLLCPC
jgi:hypothetical protein